MFCCFPALTCKHKNTSATAPDCCPMLLCEPLPTFRRSPQFSLRVPLLFFLFTALLIFWPSNCSSIPQSTPGNSHDAVSSTRSASSITRTTIHNPTYTTESVDASESDEERDSPLPAIDGSLPRELTPPPPYSLIDPLVTPSSAQQDTQQPITAQPLSHRAQTDASTPRPENVNVNANTHNGVGRDTYGTMQVYSPLSIPLDNEQSTKSSFHECFACFCDTLGV